MMFRVPSNSDDEQQDRKPVLHDAFGRLGSEDTGPDTEILNFKNPKILKASVGDYGKNHRRDVAKTEQLLGKAGTLDLKPTDGPTGFWGSRTSDATKAFQKQNGLEVDGQINPNGETIQALRKLTSQSNSGSEHDNAETLSIDVWPDGNEPAQKQRDTYTPPGRGFGDSATDDETNADDNLKFKRNERDAALQHLIEGGVDPEGAKKFLDHINWDSVTKESDNPIINFMRWTSGKIQSQMPRPEPLKSSVGGIRG